MNVPNDRIAFGKGTVHSLIALGGFGQSLAMLAFRSERHAGFGDDEPH
jgi:hypothetical protein